METAIFKIVLRELAETGYVDFSIERVAAKARTSKPVIYRRWPSRAKLVYAALRASQPLYSSQAPDTGTVRGDLMVILRRISEMVDEVGSEAFFGMAAELLHESESALYSGVQEHSTKIMTEILERGIARGEIAAKKITPRLAALPLDLARYQLMILQQPLSPQDIKEIVDQIYLPLIRAN